MRKLVPLFFIATSLTFANSSVKSLDIFANKSFVNQALDNSKSTIELLGDVKLEDIKFFMPESCVLKSFDIDTKSFEDDKLSLEIEKQKDKISFKNNSIKALNSNISFLQNSNVTKAQDVNALEQSSNFIKKQILSDYNEIYEIENELKKDNEALEALIKKRTSSKYTKLNYDIDCNSEVLVNYPIYNLQKKSHYDISFDSKKSTLELKNLLFITQSSGEDLTNIDINLYTFNYINQLKPNRFVPEYLDVKENQDISYTKTVNEMQPLLMKSARVLKAPSYEYFEDTTKSFFKASNISLVSGKESEVILAKDIYKAEKSLEIDGYSMSEAFYKVDFESKKLYGITNANLYLDRTYIGKTTLNEIKKDKSSSIYFGTNRFIEINKELVKDMKEEPFFSINKIKTEKIWNYEIKNNSKNLQKIVLLERVPVSKHEDIKVKLIGKSKESKIEKDGKIYFEFELKPNETKNINFGYEIEKPTKK